MSTAGLVFSPPPISFSTKSSRCLQGRADVSRNGGSSPVPPQSQILLRSCPAVGLLPSLAVTPTSMGSSSSSLNFARHVVKRAWELQSIILNHFSTSITLHGLTVLRAHLDFSPATSDLYKKCPNFHLFATEYCLSSCFIFSAYEK